MQGLDYFEARYYSGVQGRFTSPDEFKGGIVDPFTGQDIETNTAIPYADITDPQTLNKYAYVRNNPLRYIDPHGHCFWDLCIGEGIGLYAAGTAAVAGAAYLMTPQGKESARAAIEGTGLLINKAADAISSIFTSDAKATSQPKDVYIDPNKYPAAAGHAEDAQKAGQPDVLTVRRPGASGRRAEATAGTPTKAGTDRDEYPPAVTAEGGRGASVRNIPSSDNRGAGANVGRQIKDVPNGGKIRIVPKPKPQDQPQ
jgi:RHS repeat-associated protein